MLREPRYGIAEASRFVGMRASRVRRWLKGYSYKWSVGGEVRRGSQEPIVVDAGAEGKQGAAFLDIIELLFARSFVDKGFPLQRVRAALGEAKTIFHLEYPFAQQQFFTDGREIYLQVKKNEPEHLLQLFSKGQWVFPQVIHAVSEQITFDSESGMPLDWWPRGKEGGVLISPRISFGAPSLAGLNVKTSNIYDLFVAEDRDPDAVAKWYRIPARDVLAAVEFEERLAAA